MSDYKPCPFCGETPGEREIRETRLGPYMSGPGALVSVYVQHHCGKVVISARGRDHEQAAEEWNRRPA